MGWRMHSASYPMRSGDTGKGHTLAEDKAAFISRYSSTGYLDALGMEYGMLDRLFESINDLMIKEANAREKAMERAKNGKGK